MDIEIGTVSDRRSKSKQRKHRRRRRKGRVREKRARELGANTFRVVFLSLLVCLTLVIFFTYKSPYRYVDSLAKGSAQQRLGKFKEVEQKSAKVTQTSIRLPTVIEPNEKLSALCTKPFRFVIEQDMDYVGHDINGIDGVRSTSFEHCCAFCGKNGWMQSLYVQCEERWVLLVETRKRGEDQRK